MRYGGLNAVTVFGIVVLLCTGGPPFAASGDYDGNGYVNLVDYGFFVDCLAASGGPGRDAGTQECKDAFDNDEDSDVDARDFASFQLAQGLVPTTGDYDDNGYVDLVDYSAFEVCFTTSDGPGGDAGTPECKDAFDNNKDEDVDLADFAAFQLAQGHTPIPLRDVLGNVLIAGVTEPYSPRQTCTGSCHAHDLDSPTGIAGGYHFQEGRTDLDGNIIMGDDYFGDGRPWMQSPARYGRQTTASGLGTQLAPKDNTAESQIDRTTFAWVQDCGGCHAGGGPGEFDRAGERLYGYYEDTELFQFGYERSGLTAGDVVFDGDYANMDVVTGDLSPARWDTTGVSEPDCLLCHRADRTIEGGVDMNHAWRNETLLAGDNLVDDSDDPVPAFLAASTAGQGWFSAPAVAEGLTTLQIDYSQGLSEGSLMTNPASELNLLTSAITATPYDSSCWACHGPGANEDNIGMVWFDDRDVHFRKFNKLNDEDLYNDVPPEKSKVCTHCHAGSLGHNVAKGDSLQMHYRDELDFVGIKTCRSCHLPLFSDGVTPNPDKDPDAPDVPGDGTIQIHFMGFYQGETSGMMYRMSCQACHAPYALGEAYVFCDYTVSPG
ncbi:MAG: hypothetical protein KJ749_11150, partial [Planctomycetes bacterium]|nr:hypothetical protein [Planctomycetota bacterium]